MSRNPPVHRSTARRRIAPTSTGNQDRRNRLQIGHEQHKQRLSRIRKVSHSENQHVDEEQPSFARTSYFLESFHFTLFPIFRTVLTSNLLAAS